MGVREPKSISSPDGARLIEAKIENLSCNSGQTAEGADQDFPPSLEREIIGLKSFPPSAACAMKVQISSPCGVTAAAKHQRLEAAVGAVPGWHRTMYPLI